MLKAFAIVLFSVDIKKNVAGQVLRLGKEYKRGIYIIEASQGNQRAIIKVIKIGNHVN